MKKFTCSKRNALILLSIFIVVELIISGLKGGIHFIPMLIGLIIFILLLFFCGFFWLIKYDDVGFTYTCIGRYKIEYDDIESVTHFNMAKLDSVEIKDFDYF